MSLTCGVAWTEDGETHTDGKPAIGIVHLFYRDNAAHPSLEVAVCQEHYDQLSSRQYDVGLGLKSAAPTQVQVSYTALPIQVTISPGSNTLAPLETLQFHATVTGTSNPNVIWTAQQGTIDQTGFYTAPNSAVATVDTVQATSAANRCVFARAQVSIAAPVSVTVVVSPQSANVTAGTGSITFTAVVNGITDQTVTWSASAGGLGQTGQPAAGHVNATTGVYTPPTSLAVQSFDNVTATSVGYPAASSFSTVTINPNVAVTITPSSATVVMGQQQQFNATVTGVTNQTVVWSALLGSITPSGLYTAPGTPGVDKITASSSAVAGALAQVSISVITGTGVTVVVNPPGTTLNPGQTQQFTVTVTGITNTAVVWSVTGGVTGTAALGTISATGLYTAPASAIVQSFDTIVATPVADPAVVGVASVTINAGGTNQLDLVQWMVLSSRSSQHLVGDPSAPYSVQMMDTDPGYPANYPKNCVWQIKNRLGNPWDVHTYNQNFVTHWITDDGDAVDQAACQTANGTTCWMYSHAYKRYLTPVNVMPRFFTSQTTITIDNPAPNDVNATTDCESSAPRVVHIGAVRGITTGPFKISWGGSIDHGTGTLASGPNYDNVNGVETIRVQYQYSGNPTSGFADSEEYYYVKGFGRVAWYHYHNNAFVQKTVNTTLAATGSPTPNFPCGPGKSWFV